MINVSEILQSTVEMMRPDSRQIRSGAAKNPRPAIRQLGVRICHTATMTSRAGDAPLAHDLQWKLPLFSTDE